MPVQIAVQGKNAGIERTLLANRFCSYGCVIENELEMRFPCPVWNCITPAQFMSGPLGIFPDLPMTTPELVHHNVLVNWLIL